MRIGVVGAGIAGLSCAQALQETGHTVALFDKGRGAGGRMATRRVDTPGGPVAFDHGAQYFTARDAAFSAQVAIWEAAGVVGKWPAAGDDARVGIPGMNAIVRALATEVPVSFGQRVDVLRHHGGKWFLDPLEEPPFDAVVVATPAEQAVSLVSHHDAAIADLAREARSAPCWTAMLAFDEPVAIDADVVRDDGIVAWAARNSAKPGRTGPEA